MSLPPLLKVAREGDVDKLRPALAECRKAAGANLDRRRRLTLATEDAGANREGDGRDVGRRVKAHGTTWHQLGPVLAGPAQPLPLLPGIQFQHGNLGCIPAGKTRY